MKSDSKLRNYPEAFHHFLYEVEMATCAVRQLMQGAHEPLMKSVWTEIFAVHMRNLDEFFSSKKCEGKAKDDMRASHFVNDWTRKGSSVDASIFKRISEEISHLTYKRKIIVEEKRWNVVGCFKPILKLSLQFLNAIENDTPERLTFSDNRVRANRIRSSLMKIDEELPDISQDTASQVIGATGPAGDEELQKM